MGKNQTLESFLMSTALGQMDKQQLKATFEKAYTLYDSSLKTTVNARFGLHQIQEAIEFYIKNQSAGKVIIKPSLTPAGTPATEPVALNQRVKGILAKM
jgi:NADPH:quinone reductase-like Zn-dependent oxidoreductase